MPDFMYCEMLPRRFQGVTIIAEGEFSACQSGKTAGWYHVLHLMIRSSKAYQKAQSSRVSKLHKAATIA